MIKTYKLKNAINDLLKLGGMVYMSPESKQVWCDIIYTINQVLQDAENND